ncbi:MAG: GHKL domain-containing protein [Lachnospiraceae bacterium]|nr:GHKL domain-containing protein [Lachnospiraceae bacterium]
MRKGRQLRKEHEELKEKYIAVYGAKQETEYRLTELKEETEQWQRQDGEIRTLHQNVRQLKHDMKNHLMVIASYLNEENYEQAKAYTSEILGKLNAMHSYVETGNSLLNHIINEKLAYARAQGISIKAEIENLQFEKLSSLDFSALLTNLLDNAIEASVKEASSGRELHVMIVRCRGYETICVKNRVAESVLEKNPALQSGKKEKESHGFGVTKIKTIIEQCGGMYDFYEEEGFFCGKVFIPI